MADGEGHGQTSIRATPFEQTDAYQGQFRQVIPRAQAVRFFGVAPANGRLVLETGRVATLRLHDEAQAHMIGTGPPDFALPVANGVRAPNPNASTFGRWFGRFNAVRGIVGQVRRPLDQLMQMTIRDQGGARALIYNNDIDFRWTIKPGFKPFDAMAQITLVNGNPLNPAWFAFMVTFTPIERLGN